MTAVDRSIDGWVAERARRLELPCDDTTIARIATHARLVLQTNETMALTAVTERESFLERHVGESLEGAALVHATITGPGRLVDLGSGNGFPGLPVALACGLTPVLAEATTRKAAFLERVLDEIGVEGEVLPRAVQRPADLPQESLEVLTMRAMGGWERVIPRFARQRKNSESRTKILIWAGESTESVRRRASWSALELECRHPLPGRDRSWVWLFRAKP